MYALRSEKVASMNFCEDTKAAFTYYSFIGKYFLSGLILRMIYIHALLSDVEDQEVGICPKLQTTA